MNQSLYNSKLPSRLPHRVAAVLAMVVFPLIWVGGLVTTYDAGMAVPDWPGTYGYNMFLYPVETWLFGPFDLFVEHGHRLLGSLAGIVAIVLVVVSFRTEPRRWVRWLSVGLLAMVILQGCLGGMRVLMDARLLAKIHGCVGPAFFGLVAAFCVITSRWWWNQANRPKEQAVVRASGLIRFATLMLALSFVQLVIGAFIRHIDVMSTPRAYQALVVAHIAAAAVLLLGTIAHWTVTRWKRFKSTGIRFSINVLMLLIVVQFALGLGTYVVKFGWPVWFADMNFAAGFVVGEKTFWQMNLITAHVAVGSLILAFWSVQMMRCRCAFSNATSNSAIEPIRQAETTLVPCSTSGLVVSSSLPQAQTSS